MDMNVKHVLLLMLATVSLRAMDEPTKTDKNAIVYVKTSDDKTIGVERWKIDEMKVLLVLLEHQKDLNSLDNPIQATMITSEELELMSNALGYISLGLFQSFFYGLASAEGLLQAGSISSLGGGKLRRLVNAADRIQATGVSAFCLSYIMPDVQKQFLVPQFIDPVIKMLPITHKVLAGHPNTVNTVAFSPDGSKIVSGCLGQQSNLIVWDISNPGAITQQVLAGHPNAVRTVAFSPDGSKIISGQQNNLILWDISNPGVITHQVLAGHPNNVNTVAFSPDGSKIVSGCWGQRNNLILWDISNPGAITQQVLAGHPNAVRTVAFSPDGSKIVSGCLGQRSNLIVWDISNPGAITHQVLAGHPNAVFSVAFSPDGKMIVSGSNGQQSNLILHQLIAVAEEKALQNCNSAQAQFLYQLCLASVRGFSIQLTSPYAMGMLDGLSPIIQKLLRERLGITVAVP